MRMIQILDRVVLLDDARDDEEAVDESDAGGNGQMPDDPPRLVVV